MDRRLFLHALFAIMAGPVAANAPLQSSRPRPRPSDFAASVFPAAPRLVAQAGLSGATGYAVASARTGQILEAGSAALKLPPASVAKSITALFALERLGADHTFATRLLYTGTLRNGRLDGDLILAGGGDPTLDTDGLARLAAQAKANGLREISGRFLVWEGALPDIDAIDPKQPDHVGYNPSLSGLNLNFNRVHFEWKRSGANYQVSMEARTKRLRPGVQMARVAIADRDLPVFRYRNRSSHDSWSVARSALGGGGSRWLPVRKPGLYAADVARTLLRSYGIVVPPAAFIRQLPNSNTLAMVQSAPLREICRDMLRFSTNLTAEIIGLTASGQRNLSASGAEMARWAQGRFNVGPMKCVDHSGLGDSSRITAGDMVALLAHRQAQSVLRPLLKPFSLRETETVLRSQVRPQVFAKTGTLNFVSGLAGYASVGDGDELVFAVFSADIPTRRKIVTADMEAPSGGKAWSRKSRLLQSNLIARWGLVHG